MNTINPSFVPSTFYDASGKLTIPESVAKQISEGVAAKVADMPPAQRELFLAMLKSLNLAPSGEFSPGALDDMLGRLEGASAALNRLLSMTGSSVDLLARLMIEQAGDQRKNALNDRLNARAEARTQLEGQAAELTKAANAMITGAIVSLIVTVVMAAVSIGMSVMALKQSAAAGKAANTAKGLEEGSDAQKEMIKQAEQLANKANLFNSLSQASNTLGAGIANSTQTLAQADAKKMEAEGSILQAEAQYEMSEADLKKEAQDALNQLIQSIINFIKEMKEAEVNMMQAITRG